MSPSKMLTAGVKDINTSMSSISSAESTGNPGFETSKTSVRKRKYFTLPRNKFDNKKKTQNKISKNDFYNKTIEFRLWLHEEKKIDFDTSTEKKLREYFKKFAKKWNSKKLAMKYYVGVDPMWAVSSPGAYSRNFTRTPDTSQDMSEPNDTCSLHDTSSMFSTFGKNTGRKISEMIRGSTPPSGYNVDDFTGIRTRSATRLDAGMPRQLKDLFAGPEHQNASLSVLSPRKRHASMEELSSPCKTKESEAVMSTLKRTRSRSAVCKRYDTPTVPTAQSMDSLTNWRNSYAEPNKEEHVATILRRPGSRGSIAMKASSQVPPNSTNWRNSYAEAMNNSINTRNSVAEAAMEQMDGVFKVPGCRTSFTSKSRAPPPPPRVPAKSMENLTAWRNNQQHVIDTVDTPSLKRPESRSSIASKKTPPPLPERRSSRLSNTSIASSQGMVVVDIPTDEPKGKSWFDQQVPTPSPATWENKSGKKPMAPVAPQPIQGTPYQPVAMMCKPPMSVQKKIPPAMPLRVTQQTPGSVTKPIAPVAPQPSEPNVDRGMETARLTRRSSNSSINSRISVASIGSSSSSESSSSSGTLISSNTSSSSSSSFQDAITAMANKLNKSRKSRYSSSDSDTSSQGSFSSTSTVTSDTDSRPKVVKKRSIPPPPKFKPTLPQSQSHHVTSAPAKELDKKNASNKKRSNKAAAPPPPPPPPPLPQHLVNPQSAKVKGNRHDMSVQSGYKSQKKPTGNPMDPPLKDTSNLVITSLKMRQQQSATKSLGKKRQSEEDLNDLATVAKKLYTGTPTGVSSRHRSQVQKTRAVIESPKAVYV